MAGFLDLIIIITIAVCFIALWWSTFALIINLKHVYKIMADFLDLIESLDIRLKSLERRLRNDTDKTK